MNNEFGRWQQLNHFSDCYAGDVSANGNKVWIQFYRHADIHGISNTNAARISVTAKMSIGSVKNGIRELKEKGLLANKINNRGFVLMFDGKPLDEYEWVSRVPHNEENMGQPSDPCEQEMGQPSAPSWVSRVTYMGQPSDLYGSAECPPIQNRIIQKKTETPVSGKPVGFDVFFGKEKTKEDTKQPNEFDVRMVELLKKAVTKWRGPRDADLRKANTAVWANHFRLMREADNISPKKIEFALTWLNNHIREQYVNKPRTAKDFRDNFQKIENKLMDNVSYIGLDLEPDADATDAYSRLITLGWPKGSGDDLYKAYQISRNRYKDFRKRVTEYAATLKPWREYSELREQSLARLVAGLPDKMPASSSYTEQYFKNTVFPRVAKWEKWDGNLAMFLIDPDGKDFQQQGRVWSKEITGSEKWWNELMEEINKDAEV